MSLVDTYHRTIADALKTAGYRSAAIGCGSWRLATPLAATDGLLVVTTCVVRYWPVENRPLNTAARGYVMPPVIYKVAAARAHFSELLARAKAGEEIVIAKHQEPHARLVPPATATEREAAPLAHLGLPDDLLDDDPEQAAIDAGERTDALGIWQG